MDGSPNTEGNDRMGFIDRSGKEIISARFSARSTPTPIVRMWEFIDGIAPVMIGDGLGYIDKAGKYVRSPTE